MAHRPCMVARDVWFALSYGIASIICLPCGHPMVCLTLSSAKGPADQPVPCSCTATIA